MGRRFDLGLMLLASAQLRLARTIVVDRRLPWERPRLLTSTRVLRRFGTLPASVGTEVEPPKPCGIAPWRSMGDRTREEE